MIADEFHGQGVDDRGSVADVGDWKHKVIARRVWHAGTFALGTALGSAILASGLALRYCSISYTSLLDR